MTSPYPSENSCPDGEHTSKIVCEEAGIDLCTDYKYYESFDTFQQQQSLQASYYLVDSQFSVMYEHMSDEDLFSNMISKNMVTVNMNEIQPETKPHSEEEKRSEFEDSEPDNNISGVVDGICKNLDNEIVIDYTQTQRAVPEQSIDKDIINFDSTKELIADNILSQKVTPQQIIQTEVIQPVYTTGPSKTITVITDEPPSPIISEASSEKVVVQKITNEKLSLAQDRISESFDVLGEHEYEQKIPVSQRIENRFPQKRPIKKINLDEQSVPKKQIALEKITNEKAVTPVTGFVKQISPRNTLSNETLLPPESCKKGDEKIKTDILLPCKELEKLATQNEEKAQKSTSRAEELFDMVKNSSMDDVKKPTYTFDKSTIYIPRAAFKRASNKIQELKNQTRKRKTPDEISKSLAKQKGDVCKKVPVCESSNSVTNEKEPAYKIFKLDLDGPLNSDSDRTISSTLIVNKENKHTVRAEKRVKREKNDPQLLDKQNSHVVRANMCTSGSNRSTSTRTANKETKQTIKPEKEVKIEKNYLNSSSKQHRPERELNLERNCANASDKVHEYLGRPKEVLIRPKKYNSWLDDPDLRASLERFQRVKKLYPDNVNEK